MIMFTYRYYYNSNLPPLFSLTSLSFSRVDVKLTFLADCFTNSLLLLEVFNCVWYGTDT